MELICIICPRGCRLKVEQDQAGNWNVTGNNCKRGIDYGIQEATCPTRTLTTSIWVKDGDYKLVSVKTDRPIPRERIPEALEKLRGMVVNAPIAIGQVIIENIGETGANIVATRKVERQN